MHKKELEELYYIFIDGLFASFLIDTKYCNDKNPMLPFSTAMTNMEGKEKCNSFYHHAISFLKLSSEQDSYLFKNISDWNKDKIIKHIKNYIHDKKYAEIFCKTLDHYLIDDYTFDTILKGCLDTKSSIASRAKRDTNQHKLKTIYEQSISEASYQSSMMRSNFIVPHKDSTTYSRAISVDTLSAIKTNYAVPLIISVIPLCILFYYIIKMIIRCYHCIFKRRTRDCKMTDDNNKLPQSTFFSSGSESVQFGSGKNCDEKRF